MPIDYSKYPENWLTEIRPRILKRDRNRCKFCGVVNDSIIFRNRGSWRYIHAIDQQRIWEFTRRGYWRSQAIKILGFTKIVLTIAHLDQDITNNQDENLAALCQRCHLIHDARYRKANKNKSNGQLKLEL